MIFIEKIKNALRWRTDLLKLKIAKTYAPYVYRKYDKGLITISRLKKLALPLPELDLWHGNPVTAGKGQTSLKKWELINQAIPEGTKTAFDIGCNNGFFSLRLAQQHIFTLGIDPDEELIRMACAASIKAESKLTAFSLMNIDSSTVGYLPEVDISLVLSVAQRWTHSVGAQGMMNILQSLWSKTRKAMFFELPNPIQSTKETPHLDFLGKTEEECEKSIADILRKLGAREVQLLGYLPTDFRPDEKRHIFVGYR